jgi:hypothetical protein
MRIRHARDAMSRIFYQRCFYLFVLLLTLITLVPFLPSGNDGRLALNWVNMFVVVATVAAVGRTLMSFVIALLLALPALWFQWLGITGTSRVMSRTAGSSRGGLCGDRYVSSAVRVPSRSHDRGQALRAAAGFLMLGVVWAYFYALVGYFYAEAFSVAGKPGSVDFYEALYLSITVLTTTGFGDITPLSRQARGVCMAEQITGALFVAILIARLAGVYPPMGRDRDTG